MQGFWKGLLILTAATALPSMAWAEQVYFADLAPLNDSGVTGKARLALDGNLLTVQITAEGLEPDQVHPQHIHGRFDADGDGLPDLDDGVAIDSFVPTLDQDTDGDGFIELAEGLSEYGPVILPLTSPPGNGDFPTASADGKVNYTQTFDLTRNAPFRDEVNGINFEGNDVLPLDLRTIVLHGLSVDAGLGAGTPGEVDGEGGYLASLPVAAGEIVIPLPAAVWPGLLILGSLALRRRRRTA